MGIKSDLQRLRRYKYDGEGDELSELVADIHWAADRIEQLESALKEIASTEKRFTNHGYEIARKALEDS